MDKQAIFEILKANAIKVLGDAVKAPIEQSSSLRAMGANSIDRAEILTLTLESLEINASMFLFVDAKDISDLCDIFLTLVDNADD